MSDSNTPLWRWLVVSCLCVFGTAYVLVTGELPIDKARTVVVDRSSAFYWIFVLVFGAFGATALFKAWKRLTA
jgi:hypothetical protein